MIEINLLPTNLQPRTQAAPKKPPTLAPVPKAFPLGLVGLTALMGLFIFLSGTHVGVSERKSKQIEHTLRKTKTQATEAEKVAAELPVLSAQYEVLASRLEGKVAWAEVLRVVSLRCPEGVRLTELKVEVDKRTGFPLLFVIAGVYNSTGSLEIQFTNALKESSTFADVFEAVIPERTITPTPDGETSFSISCVFRLHTNELIDGTE